MVQIIKKKKNYLMVQESIAAASLKLLPFPKYTKNLKQKTHGKSHSAASLLLP